NLTLADRPVLTETWRERYERHQAAKDLPGHVTLQTTRREPEASAGNREDDDEDPLDDAIREHERSAADFIEKLRASMPGRSIGVLVRSNHVASRLLYELRRRGLAVSGEGGVPITDTPAVNAMLSALLLADHPGHSAAAFHVANSPLGEELGLQTREPRDVERFARSVRSGLLRDGYAGTLAKWTRRVQSHCNDKSLRRLDALIELAEEFDAGISDLRPSRFVKHAEAARVEEPDASGLQVMTIHKSKGLEFDAVVLPEVHGVFRFKPTVLIERESATGPVTAVHRAGRAEDRKVHPELCELAQAAELREMDEWLCLLYVAMTRARYALHLLVPPVTITSKGNATAGWTNLCHAALLRRALLGPAHDPHDEREEQTLYEIGNAQWSADATRDAAAASTSSQPPSPSVLQEGLGLATGRGRRTFLTASPSALHGNARTAADILRPNGGGREARQEGTQWHAMFEAVAFLDEDEPSDEALHNALDTAAPPVTDARRNALIARFRDTIHVPEVRASLSRRGATRLWRERPFAIFDDEGRLVTGRFDRVAITDASEATGSTADRSGRAPTPVGAVVIDFKTDKCSDAELAESADQHRPQLEAYRRAAAARLGIRVEDVAAELIFTHVGRVVRIA
ncbi:MAG: 3'-5' exonuclease, partial [Phycisphaeraceae bacterium]